MNTSILAANLGGSSLLSILVLVLVILAIIYFLRRA